MTVHATRIQAAGEIPSLTSTRINRKHGFYARYVKRGLDFAVVVAAMPFLIPFFALISAAIYLSDGHSPIFRQERIGMNGKRFTIWKFRTMVPNAEQLLQAHLARDDAARREWDDKQKLAVDPRCTIVGRVLRRSSMDELPQLVNVLTGEMSLIGPRPMMPCQQALYPGHGYYRLRPGITGSWQVSARNESTFAARAGFDDEYESTLGFINDLKILGRTVGVIFRGTGV